MSYYKSYRTENAVNNDEVEMRRLSTVKAVALNCGCMLLLCLFFASTNEVSF